MVSLTKKTSYGLTALSHLARTDTLCSAREIAETYGLPTSLLMNVLKELAAAGYVESVRGAHGGYRLARAPGEINLGRLATAIEGPVREAECRGGRIPVTDACDRTDCCRLADPVHRLHRRLSDLLHKLTLADIMGDGSPVSAGELSPAQPASTPDDDGDRTRDE